MVNLTSSEICNEIAEMIKDEKGKDAEIEIINNLAYTSIKFFGIHSLRVKCGRKNYIGFKNSSSLIWSNEKAMKIEQIPSEKLWSRVLFDSKEELKNLLPLFLNIYEEAFFQLNIELFSCCSRFIQCSDAKVCIQPDKRLALGCQYGKHLKNGKIFYGINRNI